MSMTLPPNAFNAFKHGPIPPPSSSGPWQCAPTNDYYRRVVLHGINQIQDLPVFKVVLRAAEPRGCKAKFEHAFELRSDVLILVGNRETVTEVGDFIDEHLHQRRMREMKRSAVAPTNITIAMDDFDPQGRDRITRTIRRDPYAVVTQLRFARDSIEVRASQDTIRDLEVLTKTLPRAI